MREDILAYQIDKSSVFTELGKLIYVPYVKTWVLSKTFCSLGLNFLIYISQL